VLTESGNLYFNSQRDGPGTNNIFRSSRVGGEYGAMLSPDGRYLFFTSSRSGMEDIYWVSVEALGLPGR
jgi:hypothetical protein